MIKRAVAQGAVWTLIAQMLCQALSIGKTLVVAKIVGPYEYGSVAVALVLLTGLTCLSQTGLMQSLVQAQSASNEMFNAVWTFEVGRGITGGLLLAAVAKPMSRILGSPRSAAVIVTFAAGFAILGFYNVAAVKLDQQMQYGRIARLQSIAVLVDFAVAIALAWRWKSGVALAVGFVASNIARVIISYVAVPFFPRFRLAKGALAKSLHFGKWIFISTAVAFFCTQLDVIVVTKMFGVADVGRYQMASTITTLPMVQIGAVISAVLFPAFSKIKDDTNRLTRYFGHSLQLVTVVLLPLAVAITFLIRDFIDVILGKQWWLVVPIVQILIVAGISRPIMSICDTLLTSTAYTRGGAIIQAVRFALLIPSLALGAKLFGIRGAAIGMSLSVTLPTLVALLLASRKLHALPDRTSLASLALPALPSAVLMALAIQAMRSVWPHVSILTVFVNGALGLSTYICALLLLDAMVGGEIVSVVQGLATAGFGRERTQIPITDSSASPILP